MSEQGDHDGGTIPRPSPFVEHVNYQPAVVRRSWIVRAWRWLTRPYRKRVRRGR